MRTARTPVGEDELLSRTAVEHTGGQYREREQPDKLTAADRLTADRAVMVS